MEPGLKRAVLGIYAIHVVVQEGQCIFSDCNTFFSGAKQAAFLGSQCFAAEIHISHVVQHAALYDISMSALYCDINSQVHKLVLLYIFIYLILSNTLSVPFVFSLLVSQMHLLCDWERCQ